MSSLTAYERLDNIRSRGHEQLTCIQMDFVRRDETIHVVQLEDGIVKELQDQCDAIIRLDERMDICL
jgi:hypothetical protein